MPTSIAANMTFWTVRSLQRKKDTIFLIFGHLRFLQNETEENSGDESEREARRTGNFQWTHNYTLRKINRAMIVPEIIIAMRKSQLLTAI